MGVGKTSASAMPLPHTYCTIKEQGASPVHSLHLSLPHYIHLYSFLCQSSCLRQCNPKISCLPVPSPASPVLKTAFSWHGESRCVCVCTPGAVNHALSPVCGEVAKNTLRYALYKPPQDRKGGWLLEGLNVTHRIAKPLR